MGSLNPQELHCDTTFFSNKYIFCLPKGYVRNKFFFPKQYLMERFRDSRAMIENNLTDPATFAAVLYMEAETSWSTIWNLSVFPERSSLSPQWSSRLSYLPRRGLLLDSDLNGQGPTREDTTFATSLWYFQKNNPKALERPSFEKSPRKQTRKGGGAILNPVEMSRIWRFMRPWASISWNKWIAMMMGMFASCIAWLESPRVPRERPLENIATAEFGDQVTFFQKVLPIGTLCELAILAYWQI